MNSTIIDDAEEASITLDAICEMAATMNETYEKMKRSPKHLYGQYYLHEKEKYDARPVTLRYYGWKLQEWDESFNCLKDMQTLVVAVFLTSRSLRFSRTPTMWEVAEVQMDLVKKHMPCGFVYCRDFKEMCARFRRYNWWEGDILKLDYESLGKYLLQNFHRMTDEERQAFFDLDVIVELINEDIRNVMPKPEPPTLSPYSEEKEMPEKLKTAKAMILWRKLQEAGYVDEHFQPTVSRPEAAIIADELAVRLEIENKWKAFEMLWNRRNMNRDYNTAMDQKKSLKFREKLKKVLG
jgi:hypothetical protein